MPNKWLIVKIENFLKKEKKMNKIYLIILSTSAIFMILFVQSSFALEKTDIVVQADYNGDGKAEKAIWRPSNGTWYIFSGKQLQIVQWGLKGDIPVPADYDGDGADEICIWRPSEGNWYISLENRSWVEKGNDYKIEQWGLNGDIPVPADYDGDGNDEICIWRPSEGNWYISLANRSWTNKGNDYQIEQWGLFGDIPVPADYDGDGSDEICIWRPSEGNWYISLANRSWSNKGSDYQVEQWGINGDKPIPADYDGDQKDEICIWRPSEGKWYISLANRSWNNKGNDYQIVKWGNQIFKPVPADYRGDGITDIAAMLYTTGTWHIYGNILLP